MQKVVLITGASSGIGFTTANYLSKKGFKVYGTGRNPRSNSFDFTLLKMDVTLPDSIHKAVAYILEKEGRIDVLINNAGIGISGPIEEIPTDEMRRVFETNLFGALEVIKSVLPAMRFQKSGLIINITSIAGYMGLPFRTAYSASKGALELMTEGLRMETKDFGIQITNLAPGDFATNIAAGRFTVKSEPTSPYFKNYKKSLDLMNEHVNHGGNPIQMAKRIEKIIQTKSPKIHYKEGAFLQKFSIVLKRILPDKWYEKMLMNHFEL